MGVRMMELLTGGLDALRYEPTAKRIRVFLGGEPVADTTDARPQVLEVSDLDLHAGAARLGVALEHVPARVAAALR